MPPKMCTILHTQHLDKVSHLVLVHDVDDDCQLTLVGTIADKHHPPDLDEPLERLHQPDGQRQMYRITRLSK